ncbi:odorant receptor 13a-like [Microplitis mediator]|uniref:odorant receptor 13a-like n=1 Tax=Microplitis mediator TaxID=375433 RepID=UPI002553AC8E|nr:odorant receptor 13a-like [Microplitis mediator]
MNILKSRHFRELKVVLTLFGQWPSQSPLQQYCARFVVLSAIFSILTPKMIKFFEVIRDIDGVIECLPMIFVHLASLTKYLNWIFNADKFKKLLVLIERDGKTLEIYQDAEIMTEWLKRMKSITTAYTTAMFSILALYLVSPAVPKIMDAISPLNESRPLIYLYQTEYYVDQEVYYIHILIHAYMTVPISVAVLVYFDILLGTHVHHACAMFKVLRTYLETIHVDIYNTQLSDEVISNKIYKKIMRCIDMHRNTLEFANALESSYNIAWLILLTYCLIALTFTGMATVMKLNQTSEAIKFIAFSIGHVFHLFFTSFQGQLLIEQSEAVFYSTYLSEWYNIPVFYKKLLIPIMMRSMTPCRISAGKVYILSLDTFSSVIQKAMSFFTVLSSMC